MQTGGYICLNGEFLKSNVPGLYPGNRAFRYGDSLSESIHASATMPQFLDVHLERLEMSMGMLSMEIPAALTENNMGSLITSLLNKNRIFGGACIRLTVYRNEGDQLLPSGNTISYLLESFPLATPKYDLNEKGLTASVSSDYIRTAGKLSAIRNASPLLFLLAAIESRKKNTDSVILLNQYGKITETADSNIFLVSAHSVFTPGIEQGCIPGVMRKIILKLAAENGYRTNDQSILTPPALLDAGEVFITNAVQGIRWIGAYQQKRYFNKVSKILTGKLNDLAFGTGRR